MEAFPQQQKTADLDVAPPRPPAAEAKNLMSMQSPTGQPSGLGAMADSPTLMTLQGLAMAKQAFQLIANGVPALAQLLSNTTADLEQMVTMAMADAQAGTQPAINAPPGVAPMMPPPPQAGPPANMAQAGMGGKPMPPGGMAGPPPPGGGGPIPPGM